MKRIIGPTLAIAAVVAASTGAGVLIRSWLFDAASPPAASAERLACDQLVQSFDAYPLLNLGNEFEGYPLTRCTRRQTPTKYDQGGSVREPATDYFVFIYGDCTPPPTGEGCAPPIEVFSDPPCGPKLAPQGSKGTTTDVRGAPVFVKLDGSVRIETSGYNVTIYATPASGVLDRATQTDTARRALATLRGANALAARMSPAAALDGGSVEKGSYCR